MGTYGTFLKNKYIYCLLFIAAILPALLAVKNIIISPDSITYALISQEILSGNGIKLPINISMENNYVFVDGVVPYLAQPPLLPTLFAILGGVTSQNYLAAQTINVISHMAISIFTFLSMKQLYGNKGIALLAGMLVSISIPLLWNTHHMISEPLFIALTTAALYFLLLSRQDSTRPLRFFIAASVFASAAIFTRYAGAALVPVLFWAAFILVRNKSVKSLIPVALAAILPIITTSALLIHNYMVTGTIVGWNPPPPDRSYFSAFTGTMKMILLQFQLGDRPIILITIFTIILFLFISVSTNMRRELSKYIYSGLDVVIVFTISYTALICHAMATAQTVFETRYVSPLVPSLFILSIITVFSVWEAIKSRGFAKLSLCGIILSLGIITFVIAYKTYLHAGMFSHKQVKQYMMLQSRTYNWIKENVEKDVIITTNRPYHLSFFGGYSTISLPHRRFNKNFQIPVNMDLFLPDRMSQSGSHILALFEKAEEQFEGSYVTKLFTNREGDASFVFLNSFPDGVVYRIKE